MHLLLNWRKLMKRLALAVLLCLPALTFADPFSVQGPSSPLTINEGKNSDPLLFTINNPADSSVTITFLDLEAHFLSGEQSDSAQLAVTGQHGFTCTGLLSDDCEFNLIVETPSRS